MARSVNYLNGAERNHVIYLSYDLPSEEGDEDHSQSGTDEWEEYVDFIQETIEHKYKSFWRCKGKWDNNETRIILENDHAIIGISEYGNIVSLSIAVNEDHQRNQDDNLAVHWINQIYPNLEKLITKTFPTTALNRIGGFSNGESIYELAKK